MSGTSHSSPRPHTPRAPGTRHTPAQWWHAQSQAAALHCPSHRHLGCPAHAARRPHSKQDTRRGSVSWSASAQGPTATRRKAVPLEKEAGDPVLIPLP